MKLSISLPDEDVAFLDRYAEDRDLDSRSAAIRSAVRHLRQSALGADYAAAWDEWSADDEAAWDVTIADGLD